MSFYSRILEILKLLDEEKYKSIARIEEKAFTRTRKLTFKDLVLSILTRKGKTLTIELMEYMENMKKESISKQAYSKHRQKLKPEIFKVLNDEYVKKIYKQREINKYGEYLLLGVDGTMIELPNSDELKEHYGLQLGQKGSVGRVRARGFGIYDILNNVMITSRIDPYNFSEKKQIECELDNLNELIPEKKILICDRYYFGIGFVHELNKKDYKYLMRMTNKHYKKEKSEMKSNDEEVELKVRNNSIFYAETEEEKKELKKLKKAKTRIIKVMLESGEEEHLATNLTKEELPYEKAKEMYFQRWGIEKAFDVLKNKINIENVSSQKVIGVEQDFYSQVLFLNMLEDMRNDAEKARKNKKNLKYEYKINTNILAGMFRRKFIEIFVIMEYIDIEKEVKRLLKKVSRYLVPIKPGRKYPRRKMHSMNKYRSNLRRNS